VTRGTLNRIRKRAEPFSFKLLSFLLFAQVVYFHSSHLLPTFLSPGYPSPVWIRDLGIVDIARYLIATYLPTCLPVAVLPPPPSGESRSRATISEDLPAMRTLSHGHAVVVRPVLWLRNYWR
jgi:hypothetical protein